jgi:hypothetical protein
MLPEMTSTMLGHERPPRRARPDDPGQPGAGDARGRSDAARSAARPYADRGSRTIGTYRVHPADCNAVARSRAFFDTLAREESRGNSDAYAVARAASDALPDCDCDTHVGTLADALGHAAAVNPDSDPAT